MIRITKFKTKEICPGDIEPQDILVYRVLDGDRIICTQSIQDMPQSESMALLQMARCMLKNVDIEEITELEDKELVEKNKLNNINKDFE